MKKLLALSLLALFNITACTQDRATFDLPGDTIIDRDNVCIYVKDAEPGDVFTQYAIYPVHETNPRRHYDILPAWKQCLPNGNYHSGETWAAEYILMKPGGALRRYLVEFIVP